MQETPVSDFFYTIKQQKREAKINIFVSKAMKIQYALSWIKFAYRFFYFTYLLCDAFIKIETI